MTRRPVRILWGLIGVCLAAGAVFSLYLWLKPEMAAEFGKLREFSAVIDVLAILFWFLVFAFYWGRHQDD
jgi:hypothetical protein